MLYKKYVKMHMKTSMQYKANMLMLSFSTMLISVGEILAVYMLFSKFESVGKWGFYEAALMFGIITAVYAFTEMFARGFDEFPKLIKGGDLDRLLVRPVNIIYQIFGSKIEYSKCCKSILGLVICGIALANMNISWTFAKVAVLASTFVCGCFVVLGVMMIGAGLSIFTVENTEFINIITNGAKELSYYPINIHNKWIKRVFTYIIPFACFNYLPLTYIMGYGSFPPLVYALSPLLGILFILPCLWFFLWSLKKYQSSGT